MGVAGLGLGAQRFGYGQPGSQGAARSGSGNYRGQYR